MILQEFTKILTKAINHYKDGFEDKNAINTQIQLQIKDGKLVFKIAYNWQPQIEVNFKQILLKKLDILNYEGLATPYLIKSLQDFAKECNAKESDVSGFFFLHPQTNELNVAFYEQSDFKKYHKLSDELSRLGI